jgi:hypothetical protein
VWRAIFKVRSKRDVCENWTSDAARVQDKASTWAIDDALSVAVAAKHYPRISAIFHARLQNIAARRNEASVIERLL